MVKQTKAIPQVIGTDGVALGLVPLTAFDFFCGGGGASLGLHRAGINMLAALNHSPVAIATHSVNFPGARHMLCDIRTQKSWGLGHADIMWASPDCTHHSIAKGGQSRDAKERALAEELLRFALNLNVNCIMIENVPAFVTWGPTTEKLDKLGQIVRDKKTGEPIMVPIKARKAEYYNAWVAALNAMGFVNYEYEILNAADFGAPQSRKRYFGIFTRKGIAIKWPTPSHDKASAHGRLPWLAVRTVLDLDDRGRSIFTQWDKGPGRKLGDRPADKTLRRILAGLRKHVIGSTERQFIHKRSSNPPDGSGHKGGSLNEATYTLATCFQPDLVTVEPSRFLFDPYAWGGATRSLERESPTIVASQDKAPLGMVTAEFMMHNYGGENRGRSLDEESTAITCSGGQQYVSTAYLTHNYSGGGQHSSLGAPHPAATCNPHGRLMTPVFIQQYNGGSDASRTLSLDGVANVVPCENRFGLVSMAFMAQSNGVSAGVSPAAKTWHLDTANRTVLAGPNQSLVQCLIQRNGTRANDDAARLTMPLSGQSPTLNTNGGNLCLMSYYGNGSLVPVRLPCPTVPTKDRFAAVGFVTGSGYGDNAPASLDGSSPTLVASRRHPYLFLAEPGSPVAAAPGDSVTMRLLKAVCRRHGIADIYMRMLKVKELKLIMGFPASYHLAGSDTKQKEMLGNAVVPQVSEAIARAMSESLFKARRKRLPKLRREVVEGWEKQLSLF